MTQPPDVNPDYQSVNRERTSGLAIAALIMGIMSIPCGVTLILPVLAIIFGAIALAQIGKPGKPTGGQGFAIAGITLGCCGFFFSALMIAILIPSLGRAKELANRSACGASLTGILKGFNVYGVENGDVYPTAFGSGGTPGVPNYAPAVATATTSDIALTNIALQGGTAKTNGDQLQCAWMLVLRGTVSGRSFICKSDPASPAYAQATAGGFFYNNFSMITAPTIAGATPQVSYGIAYPWGSNGTDITDYWKNTVDSSIPIAGDAGSGLATYDPAGVGNSSSVKFGNSSNHNGEGENIAFADAHVEFTKRPTIGQGGDNVYTLGSSLANPANYGLPISNHGAAGSWDIELLPQRTSNATSW